ncbi:MAG: hypothetical protein HY781_12335 [Chloroflexi bacterium]|nr:hypothetical protein [Chloroflexota bacterium]
MLNQTIHPAQMWMTVQEPRVSSYVPNSYLLLLSALDNGWLIEEVELLPSWDQHGFIYLVTLYLNTSTHSQQIILPKNPLVDKLLAEYLVESPVPQTSV